MSFDAYAALPVPLQHVVASGYGFRELGRRYLGSYRAVRDEMERRQWWSSEELQRFQDQCVRDLVQFCSDEVPWYRERFRSLGISPGDIRGAADLPLLPLLDKDTVRTVGSQLTPAGAGRRLIEQTTGGTTGTPLRYWASPAAVQYNYAAYETRVRRWAGTRFGDRFATLAGKRIVPLDQRRPPYWRRNVAFNQLYLSVYHLSSDTAGAYIRCLESFRPRAIVGYTSAVHRLAEHVLDRGDVGRVTPAAILVSSETLWPGMRERMEAAFQCPVFDSYGQGELVALISEAPCRQMHISVDYGAVELVDGEIVATGLFNRGMPLLRYRTGDSMGPLPGTPCECGRGLPLAGSITGRLDDVIRTPEGAVIGGAALSLVFQRAPNLRRAQVRQSHPDGVAVLCEMVAPFRPADLDHVHDELRRVLGAAIAIEVEAVDQLPRTSGGKERLIVSTIGR